MRPITLSADLAADGATLCGVRGHDEPLIQGVYESSFTKMFARAQTALGMRYRSAYQAKNAYATLALQDGENPALVARNLGISLSTLTNHYVAALQRGQLIRAAKTSENPTKTPQRS